MNSLEIKSNKIENMIYEIRGHQVMIDSDLALLYKCKNGTKEINQAVKRNVEKFPERYSFYLTDEESKSFLVTICDQKTNVDTRGGKYKNPRVFTEEGVAMLSTILRTKEACKVSIAIMDAFVMMRHYISSNLLEQRYINNQVLKNAESIKELQKAFKKVNKKKKESEIYFNGQIYDAYSKIVDIFTKAKKELIIIDGFADKVVLDMIRTLKVKVILITKENRLLKELDIEKYNKQYDNLKVVYDDTFHDRYFIIDKKTFYHCGTSVNKIGCRTFSITKLSDKDICKSLIEKINS